VLSVFVSVFCCVYSLFTATGQRSKNMRSRVGLSAIDPIYSNHVTLPDVVRAVTARIADPELDTGSDLTQFDIGLDLTQGRLPICFDVPILRDGGNQGIPLQGLIAWRNRELAIRRIWTGLCDGTLPAVVFDPVLGQPLLLEATDWRTASMIDQIIRGGFIHASACESIGRHQGARVQIPESGFRRWLKQWAHPSAPARAPRRSACLEWLREHMLANLDRAPKPQKQLFREASARFFVSERLFKEIWKDALHATGARWRPGRPPKTR
jgi:hypothetical protein